MATTTKKPAAKKKAAPKPVNYAYVFVPKDDTWADTQVFKTKALLEKAIAEGDLNLSNGRLFNVGEEVKINVTFEPVQTFKKKVKLVA